MLAKNITIAGEKANLDASCKRLLANKSILAWIMKSCMEEYRSCSVEEIAEKYIEGIPQVAQVAVNPDETNLTQEESITGIGTEDSLINEGTVTYDIRFRALVPNAEGLISLVINVEAQNDFFPGYPLIKKSLYYCSRMISAQYGTEFTDSHYENIRKVYSVWICINPPQNKQNTITRYAIKEENLVGRVTEKVENYDLLAAVMICLGNSKNADGEGVLKLLSVLLSNERRPDEKKRILQDEFDIKMTRELEEEVSNMCNYSDGIEQQALEKGREQGREQGIALGIEKSRIESIKSIMDRLKVSVEQAMELLGIPDREKTRYASLVQK